MRPRVALVAALACVGSVIPGVALAFDETAGKERIGVRVGGLATTDGLNDAYGNGWDLTLFFSEKISRHLLVDVRLGALYLGALKFEDLDDKLTNQHGIEGSMRILYITIGPMVGRSITTEYSMYASVGAGIYSVSMVFENAITPFDLSDQDFGFNGGMGLARRLSKNWSLEANATAHYFLITEDINDLYFAFTDGADAPLLVEATLGLTVDLR